jgi:hypothetical protein
MNLTEIETAVLHEIVEDNEASGMRLYLLIDFVHFYFAKPNSTIADTYQSALGTLKSLESKGLIQLIRQTFHRLDNGQYYMGSEDPVPEALISQTLREPITWRSNECYGEAVYLYVPTDAGHKIMFDSVETT